MKKILIPGIFAGIMVLGSCTIDEGYYVSPKDKERKTVYEAERTIEEYLRFAAKGFAAMAYDRASDDERIIIENILLKGFNFELKGEKWVVQSHIFSKNFVSLQKDAEGRVDKIIVSRTAHPYRDGVPLFDTCRMELKNDGKWHLFIQACSGAEDDTYNFGTADINLGVIKEEFDYPVLFEVEGNGVFEQRHMYKNIKPLEIEWEMEDGQAANYGYTYFTKWELEIKAGLQGDEKKEIKAIHDGNSIEIEVK